MPRRRNRVAELPDTISPTLLLPADSDFVAYLGLDQVPGTLQLLSCQVGVGPGLGRFGLFGLEVEGGTAAVDGHQDAAVPRSSSRRSHWVSSWRKRSAVREASASALSKLGLDNAVVVKGDITQGYPGQAPYNVILIGGTVAQVPAIIRDQLAEGGRLVAVVRGDDGIGRATHIERRGGLTSARILFDAAVPRLPEFEPAPGFAF